MAVPQTGYVQGGPSAPSITIDEDSTLSRGHGGHIIEVDTSGASVTVILPGVAIAKGMEMVIWKSAAGNNLVLDGAGAETIDGATTLTGTAQYASICVVSDGTQWVSLTRRGSWT